MLNHVRRLVLWVLITVILSLQCIFCEVSRMVESTLVTGSTSRYAPPDAYLPQPWIALIAEATGHIFYWNPESNITQYEKPLPLPPIGPGSLHELPAAPPPSRSSEPKEIQQATFAAAIEAYKKQHEVTVLVGCRTLCMIDSE